MFFVLFQVGSGVNTSCPCVCVNQNFFLLCMPMPTIGLDWLAARRFATTPRDHRLPFHGYSCGHAALAYHQAVSLLSWIEVNCLRTAAVGKAVRLSTYWQDTACHLVIALRQVALAQLYKYHHQSSKRQARPPVSDLSPQNPSF